MDPNHEKVAVITGASRGIGAGLVEAYRKLGYRVIANSRTNIDLDHPEVVTVAGNIADPATADRILTEAMTRFGRVDTLINNAGVFLPKPFISYTPDDYGLIMSVNVAGFFHLTQRVVAHMLERGHGGHVITITTSLVEYACAAVPSALTALSKGGLAAATKSLAIEYAGHGIRFNAISPGVIDTPMHSGVDARTTYAAMHPQNRIGAVTDIVHGALYLETAPFVTGETLHIDGGQSAGH